MASANDFLEPHQLEDFHSCLRDLGSSSDDFDLLQQREQPTGTVYDPQAGKVIVQCKATRVEKVYVLQSGNSRPAEFADDLQRGVFGRSKS